MASYCKKAFKVENFGFTHPTPQLFFTPQFGPTILYPIWTVIALLYHVIILAINAYLLTETFGGELQASFFLYLTNWGYLLLAIYSLVDCITTLYVHCHAKHLLEQKYGQTCTMPFFLQLTWALFTTSAVVGFAYTLVYWVVYALESVLVGDRPEDKIFQIDVWGFESMTLHLFNTVVIFMHIIISAKPSRLLHVYLPMVFCFIYVLVNALYQVITDKYIYTALDWDNTLVSIGSVAGGILILVPVVHLIFHGLIFVRTRLGKWCQTKFSINSIEKEQEMGQVNTDSRDDGDQIVLV